MFSSNFQEHDFSVFCVEAYLRSLTLNGEDSVERWILYIQMLNFDVVVFRLLNTEISKLGGM